MSAELDDLVNNFDEISNKAKKKADDEIGDKISSVTRMHKSEVNELFPEARDQQRLVELMQIVKSADDHHKKINRINSRGEEFSGVIVTLLDKFI